jgi:hypothetical protein
MMQAAHNLNFMGTIRVLILEGGDASSEQVEDTVLNAECKLDHSQEHRRFTPMRRKNLILSVVATLSLILVLLVAVSVALAAGAAGAPRVTTLSGAEEVPPADPDGSGFASIRLNVGQARVCWSISYQDIALAAAAHIHKAPAGVNGGIVVPLDPNVDGCTGADPALIQDIIDFPEEYYVNVHNADFPGGAIRGQLSNPGQSK